MKNSLTSIRIQQLTFEWLAASETSRFIRQLNQDLDTLVEQLNSEYTANKKNGCFLNQSIKDHGLLSRNSRSFDSTASPSFSHRNSHHSQDSFSVLDKLDVDINAILPTGVSPPFPIRPHAFPLTHDSPAKSVCSSDDKPTDKPVDQKKKMLSNSAQPTDNATTGRETNSISESEIIYKHASQQKNANSEENGESIEFSRLSLQKRSSSGRIKSSRGRRKISASSHSDGNNLPDYHVNDVATDSQNFQEGKKESVPVKLSNSSINRSSTKNERRDDSTQIEKVKDVVKNDVFEDFTKPVLAKAVDVLEQRKSLRAKIEKEMEDSPLTIKSKLRHKRSMSVNLTREFTSQRKKEVESSIRDIFDDISSLNLSTIENRIEAFSCTLDIPFNYLLSTATTTSISNYFSDKQKFQTKDPVLEQSDKVAVQDTVVHKRDSVPYSCKSDLPLPSSSIPAMDIQDDTFKQSPPLERCDHPYDNFSVKPLADSNEQVPPTDLISQTYPEPHEGKKICSQEAGSTMSSFDSIDKDASFLKQATVVSNTSTEKTTATETTVTQYPISISKLDLSKLHDRAWITNIHLPMRQQEKSKDEKEETNHDELFVPETVQSYDPENTQISKITPTTRVLTVSESGDDQKINENLLIEKPPVVSGFTESLAEEKQNHLLTLTADKEPECTNQELETCSNLTATPIPPSSEYFVNAPKDKLENLQKSYHDPHNKYEEEEARAAKKPFVVPDSEHPDLSRSNVQDTPDPVSADHQKNSIPKFYVRRTSSLNNIDSYTFQAIEKCFKNTQNEGRLTYTEFEERFICGLLNMSKFLAKPVFDTLASDYSITKEKLLEFWKGRFILGEDTFNFFHLIRQDHCDFIMRYDLVPFVQCVLRQHIGLSFFRNSKEFEDRYVATIIARMLYVLDLHNSERITLQDLQREEILMQRLPKELFYDLPFAPRSIPQVWRLLDCVPDVNFERRFFSYEHFYVVYCIFCELDADGDLKLDKNDLLRYDQHALGTRSINRIFSCMHKDQAGDDSLVSYEEFVVFLINDEDKTTNRSLEFWFDVVDLDGDGFIRYHEMMYFYSEQHQRLQSLNHEAPLFSDVLCQLNDILQPSVPAQFTLEDMKKNHEMSGLFFDFLINLTKLLSYEQRDPFSLRQELIEYPSFTIWDRFCKREYESILMCSYNEEKSAETDTSCQAESIQDELLLKQNEEDGNQSTTEQLGPLESSNFLASETDNSLSRKQLVESLVS